MTAAEKWAELDQVDYPVAVSSSPLPPWLDPVRVYVVPAVRRRRLPLSAELQLYWPAPRAIGAVPGRVGGEFES